MEEMCLQNIHTKFEIKQKTKDEKKVYYIRKTFGIKKRESSAVHRGLVWCVAALPDPRKGPVKIAVPAKNSNGSNELWRL